MPKIKMRANLTATLLLSILLTACASNGNAPTGKPISQSGQLKVHPGLVGQPVPAELQETPRGAASSPATNSAPAAAPANGRSAADAEKER